MDIKTVGVVGAGVMGVGVSQCLIESGLRVVLVDCSGAQLEKAMSTIRQSLRMAKMLKRIDKGVDVTNLVANIHLSESYDCLADVDYIVENVTENWQNKQEVYLAIDKIAPAECVFSANTSAVSITKIAALTQRPDKIIGMHFMNPVPQKPVVETIRGYHTSEQTIQISQQFLSQLGKKSIMVNDYPGFVSNRISHLYMNEAIWVAQDQVASAESIDAIFTDCYEHTMGPLATADLIGLDTVLDTLRVLSEAYSDAKFQPAPLLVKMVEAGKLGRKSGEGFFCYQ